MKRLCLLQEPIKHTPLEPDLLQLLESTLLVQPRIVRELGALNEGEDDSILKSDEDTTYLLEIQRIPGEGEVELRVRHWFEDQRVVPRQVGLVTSVDGLRPGGNRS